MQQIAQFELHVLSCATTTLPKFSDDEIECARLHNAGPAAIDPMSLRFVVDENITQFSAYKSPLRLLSTDEALSRREDAGRSTDLHDIYKQLAAGAKAEVDKCASANSPWLGINTQLTREQGISVSNASMALHMLGRRGTAFTVSQVGVAAPIKAWHIADLWNTSEELNVLMTAGDRWVAIYDRDNLKGRQYSDGAGLGCFRINQSPNSNFFVGLIRMPASHGAGVSADALEDQQVDACVALIESLVSRSKQPSTNLHVFSPPPDRADLKAIDTALKSQFSELAVFHDADEEHRGSAQWLRSLERFQQMNDQQPSHGAALMWDLEPGEWFGATLFRPKTGTCQA